MWRLLPFLILLFTESSQWLKIVQKVAFNIASEASYVYNLSRQKFIKSAKGVHFIEFLKTWSLRKNSVSRQVTFNRTKIATIQKFKWDILGDFKTLWLVPFITWCSRPFSQSFRVIIQDIAWMISVGDSWYAVTLSHCKVGHNTTHRKIKSKVLQ